MVKTFIKLSLFTCIINISTLAFASDFNGISIRYLTHGGSQSTHDNGDIKQEELVVRFNDNWLFGVGTQGYTNQIGTKGQKFRNSHGIINNQQDTGANYLISGWETTKTNDVWFNDHAIYVKAGELNGVESFAYQFDNAIKKNIGGQKNPRTSRLSSSARVLASVTVNEFAGIQKSFSIINRNINYSVGVDAVSQIGTMQSGVNGGLVFVLGDRKSVTFANTPASAAKGFGLWGAIVGKYVNYDIATKNAGTKKFQSEVAFGVSTNIPYANCINISVHAEVTLTSEEYGGIGKRVPTVGATAVYNF